MLCDSAAGRRAVRDWAAVPSRHRAALTELLDGDGLHVTVQLQQRAEVTTSGRDAVLVGLLERGQDGDAVAGRVTLSTMLPAAVRLALAITSRPDVLGDQDEAFALALAAVRCRPTCDGRSRPFSQRPSGPGTRTGPRRRP